MVLKQSYLSLMVKKTDADVLSLCDRPRKCKGEELHLQLSLTYELNWTPSTETTLTTFEFNDSSKTAFFLCDFIVIEMLINWLLSSSPPGTQKVEIFFPVVEVAYIPPERLFGILKSWPRKIVQSMSSNNLPGLVLFRTQLHFWNLLFDCFIMYDRTILSRQVSNYSKLDFTLPKDDELVHCVLRFISSVPIASVDFRLYLCCSTDISFAIKSSIVCSETHNLNQVFKLPNLLDSVSN